MQNMKEQILIEKTYYDVENDNNELIELNLYVMIINSDTYILEIYDSRGYYFKSENIKYTNKNELYELYSKIFSLPYQNNKNNKNNEGIQIIYCYKKYSYLKIIINCDLLNITLFCEDDVDEIIDELCKLYCIIVDLEDEFIEKISQKYPKSTFKYYNDNIYKFKYL